MKLWENESEERLIYYPAEKKTHKGTVVIFPGGAYAFLADHEGEGYARFLNAHGYDAFVCLYRVAPNRFPLPLLDARRAMRLVRANAGKFGIDKNKVAAMGSSAGGNLTALLSTCTEELKGEKTDETDGENFLPDFQILCYPVISLADDAVTHGGSKQNLFDSDTATAARLSPEKNVTNSTPPAFLWHTADDPCVPVKNSLLYSEALRDQNVPVECHIFPHGSHGLGLAENDRQVSAWSGLLLTALEKEGF